MATREIDVSDLEPPEPLEQSLAALEKMAPEDILIIHHRREPCLLYPVLEKNGLKHRSEEITNGHIQVTIYGPHVAMNTDD